LNAGAAAHAGADLQRALRFEHHLQESCSTEIVQHPWGRALLNSDFGRVWDMNFFLVTHAPRAVGAHEIAAQCEHLLARRELGHRKVVVDDEALRRSVARGFGTLGWEEERDVVMVQRRRADRLSPAGTAHEVSLEAIMPTFEAAARRAFDDEETARQILARNYLLREHAGTRFFAAEPEGVPASHCELYTDGSTAQVESVTTLELYRGRGLARAVVLAALDAARDAGCDFVFLRADDAGWPKELYRKLGFDSVGRTFAWTTTEVDKTR
jgi:GNAT superfamily N-acetyltransferase